jgi:multiple sugar transport system permease protein
VLLIANVLTMQRIRIKSIKPTEHLLDLDTHSPFWTWNPTLEHIRVLLFETDYPNWLWSTMFISVSATSLSLVASVLAAYGITVVRFKGAETVGGGFTCVLRPAQLRRTSCQAQTIVGLCV